MAVDRAQAAADLLGIGSRLRELRSAAGLTQADLAARAGIDRIALSQIENGHRDVGVSKIVALARALDMPPSALLDDAPKEPT